MAKISELAWKAFEKTGGVKEYMKYKVLSDRTQTMERGAEIGAFENRGDSNKNHKI